MRVQSVSILILCIQWTRPPDLINKLGVANLTRPGMPDHNKKIACIFSLTFYLNSIDSDELTHCAVLHLGLLPFVKLPVQGFPYTKG